MPKAENLRVVLARRPRGKPSPDDFRIETAAVPVAGNGEVLLKVRYLSIDPYMRGRMNDVQSYAKPVDLGEVMQGGTVAEVVASNNEGFSVGDVVLSHSGWQSYALSDGTDLMKLGTSGIPESAYLGVIGMPGFTAYAGLLLIGKPAPGETVVVAAASGAVGSAVGQIARLKGARAVGVAGGPEKCAYVRDELGFDAVIDHHAPDMADQLRAACPNGIDVYFENVSGKVWDAVLPLFNEFARVPVCGLIAMYNAFGAPEGRDRLPLAMGSILSKSLTVRGFIQREFVDHRPDFYRDMEKWIAEGKVKYREDVVTGLENAPTALMGILEGKNFGKLLVRLAD